MSETIPIQIRWPKSLALELRALAGRRHTTVSELTRQAVIDQFGLCADDHSSDKSETKTFTGGSLS